MYYAVIIRKDGGIEFTSFSNEEDAGSYISTRLKGGKKGVHRFGILKGILFDKGD